MIRYTLHCDRDHDFEAWFRSSDDYDRAAKAGENLCPVCGSAKVEKAPMAPAVGRSGESEKMTLAAAPDPRQVAMREALTELRRRVTENADYVGDRFAEEARKIHYEEAKPRGIFGEATREEAEALAEEEIEFHPLPPLFDERN
jgi:hypothetical protein